MYSNLSTISFPKITLPDGRTIDAPHPEWAENWAKWRWLLDSYEGGDAYRFAVYPVPASPFVFLDATAMVGQIRNLVPHKLEWEMGPGAAGCPTSPDYALRLMRTPVPTIFAEAIDKHLGAIFNQEIRRTGPDVLEQWWKDVDGRGSSADHWMSSRVAPLLLTMGNLDVVFDHPPIPAGSTVKTKADVARLKLDRCLASLALPENVVWWTLDWTGEYTEVLIREPKAAAACTYVYWNATEWVRYDDKGKQLEGKQGGDTHDYGVVPIFRGMDDPIRPRCENVAMARYESVAEIQRDVYNRESELVLNDASQSHPIPTGPEQYCKANAVVPLGPNNVLPKPIVTKGTSSIEQTWDYVDPPKGAPESLRANLANAYDRADRATCQTKPAGAAGSTGETVAQSGVSKRLDQSDAYDLLAEIAKVLQRFEEKSARLAHIVLTGGKEPPEGSIKIEYPTEFDLDSLPEFLDGSERFEALLSMVGAMPVTESRILQKTVRLLLPGLPDEVYESFDAEIETHLETRKEAIEQAAEMQESIQIDAANGGPVTSNQQINAAGNPPQPQATVESNPR